MRRHALATGSARAPAQLQAKSEPELLSAINTTPLIDVLLVLLIMIIITIPLAMNKIPLDLPQPGEAPAAVTHVLALDRAGQVTIDGEPLTDPALTARLRRIATVGDVLTMRSDPEVRYERFAQTLAVVKRAGVTRLGFERVAAE